jgi:hypothetical protein
MISRRPIQKISAPEMAPAPDDFHEWVLSLPWVVERPYSLATPGVRTFAVDCEPLDRRQMWLVTGLRKSFDGDPGIAVIVPGDAASEIEQAGRGRNLSPMPAGHVLMTVRGEVGDRARIEALVLSAYSFAMA